MSEFFTMPVCTKSRTPTVALPTWELPRFYAPDGTPVEATQAWLEAYAETQAERELRELKDMVRGLMGETPRRAPIQGAREQAQGTDAEFDAVLASVGFERARA